jgi:DNA-binding response OmpR family regulator
LYGTAIELSSARGQLARLAQVTQEPNMTEASKVIAFDVDANSLTSLQQAFPQCQVEAVSGATADTLKQDWSPGVAELLVVGARDDVGATLGLCRGLRSQAGRAHTPLLVLVLPGQESLVKQALRASADGCLVVPIHPKNLMQMMARSRDGDRPGRHTLGLDRAQGEDPWRDEGGEA